MNIIFEFKSVFVIFLFVILWLRFLRFVIPKNSVSGPESIGRALGFVFITEIVFSMSVALVMASVNRVFDSPILNEVLYSFKLIGFYAVAAVGSYIAMKTKENTHSMNLKIYAAIVALPNALVSLPSFVSSGLLGYSLVGVPVVSLLSGAFLLKKFPENYES